MLTGTSRRIVVAGLASVFMTGARPALAQTRVECASWQMGSRPEDIAVVGGSARGSSAATISTIEHLGPETLVGFVFGGDWRGGYGQDTSETFARVPGDSALKPRQTIAPRFDAARVADLQPATGRKVSHAAQG